MLDFTLSPQHQQLQQLYRSFAQGRVKPLAREMDEREEFDMALLQEMNVARRDF